MDTFAQNVIHLLDCQFAWLLALEKDELVTMSLASDKSAHALRSFRATIERYYVSTTFPFVSNDNPPAHVLLRNTALLNVPTGYLDQVPGGIPLVLALNDIGVHYISFLPLMDDDMPIGVLVVGSGVKALMDQQSVRHSIEMLARQAVLELRERQTRALLFNMTASAESETRLRQVLLDAIPYPAVILNTENEVVQSNSYFDELFVNRSDRVTDIVNLFAKESRSSALYAIMSNDHTSMTPYQIQNAAGEIVDVMMMVSPINLHQGQPVLRVVHLRPAQQPQHTSGWQEEQATRLKALTKASQALTSTLPLQDQLDVILRSVIEVVDASTASILLTDFDNPDDLIYVSALGIDSIEMMGQRVTSSEGIVGWVATEGKPQLIANVRHDPRYQPSVDNPEQLVVHSMAVIPLRSGDGIIGVLSILNKRDGIFDEHDLELLESLGASATVAIQNASLFDQTNRRLGELTTLLEASAAVTSTLELDNILQHITRRLLHTLTVQQVVVATADDSGDTLSVMASMVDSEWQSHNCLRLALDQLPLKELALDQRMITYASLEVTDLDEAERTELAARGMGSLLNIPLRDRDSVIGVVTLYHPEHEYQFDTIQQTAATDVIEQWARNGSLDDLRGLAYRVMQATHMDWCAIYLIEGQDLCLRREIGSVYANDRNGTLWGLHQFPTMYKVIRTGEPQLSWVNDLDHDPYEQTYMQYTGMQSCLMVPLIIRGRTSGLVKLLATERRLFDGGELSMVQGIANSVGNALENAALYLSLEQRARAVEAAYRDLESADQLKDNLLQNLSHEISTPLMHILGYVNLLKDGEFGDVSLEQAEIMAQVAEKADHIAEIVRDMVAAFATRSGKLNLKRVKLESIAALVMRSVSGKAKASGIQIVPQIGDDLPRVLVDQQMISQVFEALLENAVKFSHTGGQVEVIIRDPGGPMIETCIRDHGIGIPKDEHEKIFMRFYQVHGGAARRFAGTGLGLSIAYDVIDSHGGKIWVESEPDEGTAIYFTVPKATLKRATQTIDNSTVST